jgi:uncharacterized membrane protein
LRDDSTADRLATNSMEGESWVFKRNCALKPWQLLATLGLLCLVSGVVAAVFWWRGAVLILPFTLLEWLAASVAFWVYARHAGDREQLQLSGDTVVLECELAGVTERVEFRREWVNLRVLPGRWPLIELSEGRRRAVFGRFLRPDRLEALERDIRQALRGRW